MHDSNSRRPATGGVAEGLFLHHVVVHHFEQLLVNDDGHGEALGESGSDSGIKKAPPG
jgi:hypothetical protein